MVFKYWRPSFLESRNSVIHFHDVVYISDMLWTLDRKLIEEDFSDKLRPVLMATLRELNCRRVLFNDSTPSVGMSYYKRTGNQDRGWQWTPKWLWISLPIKCDSEVGWKRQNKSGIFWMEWKALFCFVVWRGNSSFYAFALGSFYVECLVACIIVRSFPLCGIILL